MTQGPCTHCGFERDEHRKGTFNCPTGVGRWSRHASFTPYPTAGATVPTLEEVPAPRLPKGDAERKALPVFDVLSRYFPLAICEVVKVCVVGNEQHNPGESLHWARGKSTDQLNTAQRHMLDHGMGQIFDDDPNVEITRKDGTKFKPSHRTRHLAKAAWRILAQLELDCEAEQAGPPPPASRRVRLASLYNGDPNLSAKDAWRQCVGVLLGPAAWWPIDRELGLTSLSLDAYSRSSYSRPSTQQTESAFLRAWDEAR